MGNGVFPIQVHEDMEGNKWHKQEKKEAKVKQGVDGVHAILPFQCEDCWMINLEGRRLRLPQDELYFMLIRRANLDAMQGRSEDTIRGHVRSIGRTIKDCAIIGKTPSLKAIGPMPLFDSVGMSAVAVEVLYYSITAEGKLGPKIQFETMRKHRSTFSLNYASSADGIGERSNSFSKGFGNFALTKCPSQSEFFSFS